MSKSRFDWPYAHLEVGESVEFDAADFGVTSFYEFRQHRLRNYCKYHHQTIAAEALPGPPDQIRVRVTRSA